jgi:cell division protein FtsQ
MVTMRQRVRRPSFFAARRNRRVRPRPEGTAAVGGSGVPVAVAAGEGSGEATLRVDAPPAAPRGARLRAGLRRAAGALGRGLKVAARVLGAVLLAAAVGAGGWATYRAMRTSPRFMVRQVTFTPTHHVTREELAALAAVSPGVNIFGVDLARVQRDLAAHPWLAQVTVRRELPARIAVTVTEREPALLVELGGLYLADREGRVFKRAEPDETAGVVTGIARETYLRERARAEARFRGALTVLQQYSAGPGRPALGEIHLEADGGVVLYTLQGGTALRLGQGDLPAKLQRFDIVWRALGDRQARVRTVHLDNRTRPDRVTLRLDPDPEAAPLAVAAPR